MTSAMSELNYFGGDGVSLFETCPLEDILADIAVGWNDTRRIIGNLRSSTTPELSYVL